MIWQRKHPSLDSPSPRIRDIGYNDVLAGSQQTHATAHLLTQEDVTPQEYEDLVQFASGRYRDIAPWAIMTEVLCLWGVVAVHSSYGAWVKFPYRTPGDLRRPRHALWESLERLLAAWNADPVSETAQYNLVNVRTRNDPRVLFSFYGIRDIVESLCDKEDITDTELERLARLGAKLGCSVPGCYFEGPRMHKHGIDPGEWYPWVLNCEPLGKGLLCPSHFHSSVFLGHRMGLHLAPQLASHSCGHLASVRLFSQLSNARSTSGLSL